jgi:ketosteroid isomerase-like protein
MYKAAVRWMVRRNIARLNTGDYRSTLAMFAPDAVLAFPGQNSWATQFRPVERGRDLFPTHRGRDEIEAFLRRYTETGIQMVVDDVLVNGPPWKTRIAVRVHHWVPGPDGRDQYRNRAILFATAAWGRIHTEEDYEDTELVAAFDARSRAARSAAR